MKLFCRKSLNSDQIDDKRFSTGNSAKNNKKSGISPTLFPMSAHLHLRIQRLLRQLFFSSLTRRIVILNIAALAVLVTGILYLNQFRDGLIEAKVKSLCTQGKLSLEPLPLLQQSIPILFLLILKNF